MTKEKRINKFPQPQRDVIKIGVLMQYGINNVKVIKKALECENTNEKIESIYNILDNTTITPEQKIFVVQKLLAYPKVVRLSVASQLEKKLAEEIKKESFDFDCYYEPVEQININKNLMV